MYMLRILTPPLTRLCALTAASFLLLSAPLVAAPACKGGSITTRISDSREGQQIRNAAELSSALRNARGGEVFSLTSGNYGALSIATAFSKPVTLRSADPKAPACFTEVRLNGAGNVTFDGLIFDYAYTPGDRDATNKFNIQQSHDITISNSVFDGDYKAGLGHGRGLRIKESVSISILGNTFRKWWKAVTGGHSSDFTLRSNNIYDIRSDGMGFGGVNGLTIENNYMHDFRGARNGDHRDMLQIARGAGIPSRDVMIRNNVFDMGAGSLTQTIFMGNSGKDVNDPQVRHKNVLIENNVIYNAHVHGITVSGIDNLSIRKNSIIRVRRENNKKVTIPRISVLSSTTVVIEQNVVSGIKGYKNQPDWYVANNAIIQDTSPSVPGYYDRQFIYYATGATKGYHEYGVRPNSIIDQLNAGSTLVKTYPTRR